MTALALAASMIERDWPVADVQVQSLVDDLRQSDERTRFALGVARTGIWEAELVTGQMEWSETMHLVMGRAASAFGGTVDGFKDLLHPDDRDKFSRIVHGNFDDHRDFQIDVRVPWPNGAIHWVQLRGRVRSIEGTSIQLLAVAQDITEYKELELQLRQSQKMEAMGRLAGGVAHDFNNILTAILGFAMLIEGDAHDEGLSRMYASQISKAAERAASLTRQLLAFSRRQVIERRAVDLSDVITDLLPMMSKILGEQIEVVRDFAPSVDPVFADAGQLQQVVLNLAVNARDAMPKGGQLAIKTENVTLGDTGVAVRFKLTRGDYVLLTVADTGTGMDASTRERIFEPFFTTKDAGQGTGLGLATVFEIVKSLGGAIRVSSEPGEGTTFRVYLPKATAATVTDGDQPAIAQVIGGTETVLVVEDEETVRRLVSDILRRNGYTVLMAGEAGEAQMIAAEATQPIDLVLADVMMPDGTGPELVAALRSSDRGPRALYMSGYAGAVLARQGRMAVDSEFLQKPFTGEQLLAKVRRILDAPAA